MFTMYIHASTCIHKQHNMTVAAPHFIARNCLVELLALPVFQIPPYSDQCSLFGEYSIAYDRTLLPQLDTTTQHDTNHHVVAKSMQLQTVLFLPVRPHQFSTAYIHVHIHLVPQVFKYSRLPRACTACTTRTEHTTSHPLTRHYSDQVTHSYLIYALLLAQMAH